MVGLVLCISCSDNDDPTAASSPVGWHSQPVASQRDINSVFFLDAQRGWAVTRNDSILKTNDGGKNWKGIDCGCGFGIGDRKLESIYFLDKDRGWAVGESGHLLRSIDGGETWNEQMYNHDHPEFKGHDLRSLAFVGGQHGWFISAYSGRWYLSTDGGETWDIKHASNDFSDHWNQMIFTSPDVGVVVGSRQIVSEHVGLIRRTTDGGLSWDEQVFDGLGSISSVSFANPLRAWAATWDGQILRSDDGGQTWDQRLRISTEPIENILFVNESEGWLISHLPNVLYGGVWYNAIRHTTDGGLTWSFQTQDVNLFGSAVISLHDLFFVDDRLGWAVGSNGTILHTASGGRVQ